MKNKLLYPYKITLLQSFRRLIFIIFWFIFCRYSPPLFHRYRIFFLNLFGAKIDFSCFVYPSARIWDPVNLFMVNKSCIGPRVNVYNIAKIQLSKNANVSQDTTLCTATHDYEDKNFRLITGEIIINESSWIGAEVFIFPGVTVGKFAVIGARSVVSKSVSNNVLVVGNPGREVKIIRKDFI